MLFIPNEKLRQSFVSLQDKIIKAVSILLAAWERRLSNREEWLTALLDYLKENIDFALSFP